jgi:hypothetical protein
MAVVIESPDEVLGLGEVGLATVMQRTQPEGSRSGPGETDRTIHRCVGSCAWPPRATRRS